MSIQADIVGYDNQGKLTLVVEVKKKLGTDGEWAAKMRHNIVAYSSLSKVRFFLLALPDHFYLWKDKSSAKTEKPTYEIDPISVLKPYLEKANLQIEKLSSSGFEMLITFWLNELLELSESSENFEHNDANKWLIESGLLDAIKHGRIESEITI